MLFYVSLSAKAKVVSLEPPVEYFYWCIPYVVFGWPRPSIRWLKNGQPLEETALVFNTELPSPKANLLRGCLTMTMSLRENHGYYTLVTWNKLGTENKTVYANFLKPPGKKLP